MRAILPFVLVAAFCAAQTPSDCNGCRLTLSVSWMADDVEVTIDWGTSTPGECKLEPPSGGNETAVCAPSSGCEFAGVLLKTDNSGGTQLWGRWSDGWIVVPPKDSAAVSFDDGPMPCGSGYLWTLREKRDTSATPVGWVYVLCSSCDWGGSGG